ncbi:MAG: diguanylate cyclase, partial [Leeuwenhoekiella sp.]
GLEEMMFITSHKVRQPVAHILGVSILLDLNTDYSLVELKNIVSYIKHSAVALDDFTREISTFMANLEMRIKN